MINQITTKLMFLVYITQYNKISQNWYNFYVSQKVERKISRKRVKRNFSTIGLLLLIYAMFVLVLPYAFYTYMVDTNSSILKDEILYYGIYFITLFFGTVIPFSIMRRFSKIKIKRITRSISASFVDLFVQTIVFFTICVALTFVSTTIANYIGFEGKLISSIGFNYDSSNLSNHLYVFLLIVVSPILEEYAFRGVLLNSLSRYGKRFALVASSLIFALAHSNFAEMLPAFAMGISLGKTSLRYKSIQPSIVIHILFNAFIYLLCVIPSNVAGYMAYGLVAICILAIYLYLSGRYERIVIQKTKTNSIANSLFFSRVSVILSLLIMVIYTVLMTFTY